MITGFTNIQKSMSGQENFWELNPHMIHVSPFADLYTVDNSKDKEVSSKHMWCIVWLVDPDEEVNKYYRIPKDERLNVIKSYNPLFDPTDLDIEDCINQYPYLCMSADELAYKQQKDQLIEISQFLSTQEITMETIADLIKLKALLPKIYQDFEKIEKSFIKTKNETRVFGQRSLNAREKGDLQPDE
jgi:hypothetical protein